jgi:hypothetical protein
VTRKIFEGLGPGSLIPQRGSLPLNDPRLGPEEGFVLSRIDGYTSLEEVCLLVPFEEQVAMVILRKLWEMGAIEVPGVARVMRPRSDAHVPKPAPTDALVTAKSDRGNLTEQQAHRIDEVFSGLESRTAFELLGVTPDADSKELKRAYFKMSKEFHPDRFYGVSLGDYGKKLTAIFQAIKNAFEILSDEKRRAAYLESLVHPE